MAEKKRPGDIRRQRRKPRKRVKGKPKFDRPREWAERELVGVLDWLKRLKGSGKANFPENWRHGQIKHYTERARTLRAEIEAVKQAEKTVESDPGDPPNAA